MGAFLVILSAFGFSTLGIFGKIAMDSGVPRNDALFWRFLLAMPFFAVVLVITKTIPRSREPFIKAMIVGGIGVGVESTLFFLTLEQVGAGLTAIFLYLYPAFVALISHFFLNEKLSRVQWACIALAFLGCVFTVNVTGARVNVTGTVYGILTGAWYALYLLAGAKVGKEENPLIISAGVTCGSLLAFSIVALYSLTVGPGLVTPMTQKQWIALLGLATIATVLPFATLYAGMKRVGVTKTSLLSTLEMVFTLVLAAAFLDEKLTLIQFFGAFLILLSVLLIKLIR